MPPKTYNCKSALYCTKAVPAGTTACKPLPCLRFLCSDFLKTAVPLLEHSRNRRPLFRQCSISVPAKKTEPERRKPLLYLKNRALFRMFRQKYYIPPHLHKFHRKNWGIKNLWSGLLGKSVVCVVSQGGATHGTDINQRPVPGRGTG